MQSYHSLSDDVFCSLTEPCALKLQERTLGSIFFGMVLVKTHGLVRSTAVMHPAIYFGRNPRSAMLLIDNYDAIRQNAICAHSFARSTRPQTYQVVIIGIRPFRFVIFPVDLFDKRGGGGVDMDEYARSMSSTRCDGDHITLQALCDALKARDFSILSRTDSVA